MKKETKEKKKLELIKKAKESAEKYRHRTIITPYEIISGGA